MTLQRAMLRLRAPATGDLAALWVHASHNAILDQSEAMVQAVWLPIGPRKMMKNGIKPSRQIVLWGIKLSIWIYAQVIVQCLQILSNSGSIPLSDNWAQGSFGSDIWTMKSHEGPEMPFVSSGAMAMAVLQSKTDSRTPQSVISSSHPWSGPLVDLGKLLGVPNSQDVTSSFFRQSCSTCCFPGESWNKAYTGNACKIMQVNSLASLNFRNKTQLANMFLFGGSNHPKICANWTHPSRPVSYQLTTAYPHCPHANTCQ